MEKLNYSLEDLHYKTKLEWQNKKDELGKMWEEIEIVRSQGNREIANVLCMKYSNEHSKFMEISKKYQEIRWDLMTEQLRNKFNTLTRMVG